ncbi:hypothetical protein PoB_006617600 [Plakobranchus ocellatus]|uniref:Uncharacterized protein n=1 Tax=Plakobranchus ocellatus TaxID=259542 RepID=A0AAV4D671_9GAST|nr:hypothetical protein PoB_006617600 [Plakobranchus ocellatus]
MTKLRLHACDLCIPQGTKLYSTERQGPLPPRKDQGSQATVNIFRANGHLSTPTGPLALSRETKTPVAWRVYRESIVPSPGSLHGTANRRRLRSLQGFRPK